MRGEVANMMKVSRRTSTGRHPEESVDSENTQNQFTPDALFKFIAEWMR